MHVANMLAGKNHIQIANIPVGAVFFGIRTAIDNILYSPRCFIKSHIKTYDLPRLPANHRYDIHIFPCL